MTFWHNLAKTNQLSIIFGSYKLSSNCLLTVPGKSNMGYKPPAVSMATRFRTLAQLMQQTMEVCRDDLI